MTYELKYGPEDYCANCGAFLDWVDCWNGCDDGWFDEYEDDAINFAPGEEYRQCSQCEGKGGWLVCGNCYPQAVQP